MRIGLLGALIVVVPLTAFAQVETLPKPTKLPTEPTPKLEPIVPIPPIRLGDDTNTDLRRLRKEREALAREREVAPIPRDSGTDSLATEKARLRQQLTDLLKRLNERKAPVEVVAPPKPAFDDSAKSLDPLNQAQALYRAGNYEAALRAFKLVDSAALGGEDRSFVQYMIASCLRRQGKLSEASAIYREVADSHDDAFLAECAIWQIGNINWQKELESQLEQLKQRRRAVKP